MKRCGKCAEKIQDKALVCRYCATEQPKRNEQSNRALYIVVGVVLLTCLIGSRFTDPTPPSAVETKPPALGEKCKGYNGEARNLSGLVKQTLRNPASFEHVETTYGPVDNGMMTASMTYRATNGYGAVDTYLAVGKVRASDCGAVVLTAG